MTRLRELAVPIFGVAGAVVLLHLLDDAFVDGPRGVSVWSNLATDAVPMAALLVAVIAFMFLPDAVRAWMAFVVGALLVIDGGLHIAHIVKNGGLGGSDLTGLLAGAGRESCSSASRSSSSPGRRRRDGRCRAGARASASCS